MDATPIVDGCNELIEGYNEFERSCVPSFRFRRLNQTI